MARERKVHGRIGGESFTICGRFAKDVEVIDRPTQVGPRSQLGQWESAVTCENCWRSFP